MSLARNVATVGSATLLSRVLGFTRDVLIASIFGTGIRADAFFVAFQLANLVRRVLAEGALVAGAVVHLTWEHDAFHTDRRWVDLGLVPYGETLQTPGKFEGTTRPPTDSGRYIRWNIGHSGAVG